jgi:putative membrane protein
MPEVTEGEEDPRPRLAYDRTLLANERTYAAWLRTGLGAAAFGIALAHLPQAPSPAELAVADAMLAIGALVILYGGWRFVRVSRELSGPGSPAVRAEPLVVGALTLVAAVLVAVLLAAG